MRAELDVAERLVVHTRRSAEWRATFAPAVATDLEVLMQNDRVLAIRPDRRTGFETLDISALSGVIRSSGGQRIRVAYLAPRGMAAADVDVLVREHLTVAARGRHWRPVVTHLRSLFAAVAARMPDVVTADCEVGILWRDPHGVLHQEHAA